MDDDEIAPWTAAASAAGAHGSFRAPKSAGKAGAILCFPKRFRETNGLVLFPAASLAARVERWSEAEWAAREGVLEVPRPGPEVRSRWLEAGRA